MRKQEGQRGQTTVFEEIVTHLILV